MAYPAEVSELWGEFLTDGASHGHGVELYADSGQLVESVVDFLAAGLAVGAAGVVVATPGHLTEVVDGLAERGHEDPLLFTADAERTLDSLHADGELSEQAFEAVIGGLLDAAEAAAPAQPRVFGEMVDLLCLHGRVDHALALEELWEGLRRRRRFALLCGYRLDVFDPATQAGPLPAICNTHTHVLPAHDARRFDEAVTRALTEVVGPAVTRDIFYVVSRPLRSRRVPVAQDALRWLSTGFPVEAEQVLAAARQYYCAP
jgi:hypothetical protein